MSFKTFFEAEENKDQDYINSLIANLHLSPKNLRKAYKDVPQVLSNFTDENGKRKNSLNAVLYDLDKNLKNGKATVLTPDGDMAVTYTKDARPIFKMDGSRKKYGISRQNALDMLTQGMPKSSSLGGSTPSLGGPIS